MVPFPNQNNHTFRGPNDRKGRAKIARWLSGIFLAISATLLIGCAGLSAEATPTLAATAAILPATATVEVVVSPTALPPTATVPPPTPSPTPCAYTVQPDLSEFWNEAEIGCPLNPGEVAISTAYAPFEGGQMLWRSDTDTIYVLFNDGRWESYPNEWRQSAQEYSCGEESSPPTPVRGFGRVWCDHPAVRQTLGAVTAAEIGDNAGAVQDFGNGTILVAPFGSRFVFVNEIGMWRRIDVELPH